MNELISLLVELVLIPAISVVAVFLVKYFKAKAEEAVTNTDNAALQQLLCEAGDAVTAAVAYTAQTYVDALKAQGSFDSAAQKTALSTALQKAKLLLTQDSGELLSSLYGDLDEWLTTKLEQAVRQQKAQG